MAVKENEITKMLTDLTDAGWFRVVNAAGESKDLLKTLLTLPQSQIVGLVDALAALSVTPVIKSQTAFIKASGVLNGSGRTVAVITDEAGLNLAFNGDYTAVTPFEVDDLGFIKNVIAWDDSVVGESTVAPSVRTMSRQLIFSSLGILYREWASDVWGVPIFMGGTNSNFSTTRANLLDLKNTNKLTPGTLYQITDHANDYGLVIEAATASLFQPEGVRFGKIPAHPVAGTYDTVVWIGEWRITIGNAGVAAGNKAVFMGRVWTNLTGNIGTVDGTNEWNLDATNWVLSTEAADYVGQVRSCIYDIASDWVFFETDGYGNTFGSATIPSDGFKTEYNNWEFNLGANVKMYNNECSRIYNNRPIAGAAIYENKGDGKIFDNDLCNQVSDEITEISYNSVFANIAGNNIANSLLSFNTVHQSGSIASNTMADGRYIMRNDVIGHISMCDDCDMTDNIIESAGWLLNVNCNGFSIKGSTIDSMQEDLTLTADMIIRESKGKIVGSIAINAGTFTIATGTTYLAKTIATGMTITTVRANGITVTGQTLIAQYAGWHRAKATMSLDIGTGSVFESAIFVNSAAVAGLYDKVAYSADYNKRVEIDNYVLLAVGDVVSIRHKHDQAGTLTYTHYSSSFTLEYDN